MDLASEDPGKDTTIMFQYAQAQYALSPTLLHFFGGEHFRYMVVVLTNPDNRAMMLEHLKAEPVVEWEDGLMLVEARRP